jgi:hypothetical protein
VSHACHFFLFEAFQDVAKFFRSKAQLGTDGGPIYLKKRTRDSRREECSHFKNSAYELRLIRKSGKIGSKLLLR